MHGDAKLDTSLSKPVPEHQVSIPSATAAGTAVFTASLIHPDQTAVTRTTGRYIVHVKKLFTALGCGLLLLTVICQDTATSPEEKDPDSGQSTEKAMGVFRILIDQDAQSTSFSGALYNGLNPELPWELVMSSGELELLVPEHPFCPDGCGSGLCVADDSCALDPDRITAGTVTVTGVNLSNGTTSFTAKPIGTMYTAAVSFAEPPFDAASSITLSAEGSTDASAFSLTTSGVEPIVLHNDSIVMADGEPITLSWTPPSVSGTTVMEIEMDISYHGGTKAKIVGECDDDGTLEIPADMLTKLKSYGISGFPKITMTRRSSSAVSASARAQLVIEATQRVYIDIPGVVSCDPGSGDAQCPEGQTCGDDRRCR
jgi:hypothetical protein